MKKDIKDYLHFYLGCYILIGKDTVYPVQGILKGVYCYDRKGLDLSVQVLTKYGQNLTYKIDQATLILRPLSGMTEEEEREYHIRKRRNGYMYEIHADNTIWLLSKEFDLFGLHEAGLCLYKNEKGELY